MFSYSYKNLKRIIQTENGKKIFKKYEEEYEKNYKGKEIECLKYSDYKLIYINGDRERYQKRYYEKIKRLAFLQILALGDDKYVEDLEEILAAICDEFTWVLPAHNLLKDNTFDYTIIDLFAAERAMYLSETVYVLGDKLSIDIKDRVKAALKSKIIDNYESRSFLFDKCQHNWAAVCTCGVGVTYLYQFPERFEKVKDRIFNAFSNYVGGIEDDGATTEGVLYWEYGFGMFSIFHDVYVGLTGDIPFTLKNPKIKKTLKFVKDAYLGDGFILPFADGGAEGFSFNSTIYYAIKNLFGDDFAPLPTIDRLYTGKALGYRLLNGVDKFGYMDDIKTENVNVFYPKTEYFINKNDNYVFVAKCGNNSEMHNHNDVGSFEIIKDKKKIFADLGAGKYTWAYHNDHTENGRYGKEIFVCGSWGHSLPIVNGKPQKNNHRQDGSIYSGKVLFTDEKTFKMDIAGAYDGGVDKLEIEYILKENSVLINYDCKNLENNVIFRFISKTKPKIIDGGVKVLGTTLISKSKINAKIEKVSYCGHDCHERQTEILDVYTIDFEIQNGGDVKEQFIIEL